jgi:hypothetical protein
MFLLAASASRFSRTATSWTRRFAKILRVQEAHVVPTAAYEPVLVEATNRDAPSFVTVARIRTRSVKFWAQGHIGPDDCGEVVEGDLGSRSKLGMRNTGDGFAENPTVRRRGRRTFRKLGHIEALRLELRTGFIGIDTFGPQPYRAASFVATGDQFVFGVSPRPLYEIQLRFGRSNALSPPTGERYPPRTIGLHTNGCGNLDV